MCEIPDGLKDHILPEPLLTEEGFVNEAGIKGLFAAINNMPNWYERVKDDPECTEKGWCHLHDITGALAKWAISDNRRMVVPITLKWLSSICQRV